MKILLLLLLIVQGNKCGTNHKNIIRDYWEVKDIRPGWTEIDIAGRFHLSEATDNYTIKCIEEKYDGNIMVITIKILTINLRYIVNTTYELSSNYSRMIETSTVTSSVSTSRTSVVTDAVASGTAVFQLKGKDLPYTLNATNNVLDYYYKDTQILELFCSTGSTTKAGSNITLTWHLTDKNIIRNLWGGKDIRPGWTEIDIGGRFHLSEATDNYTIKCIEEEKYDGNDSMVITIKILTINLRYIWPINTTYELSSFNTLLYAGLGASVILIGCILVVVGYCKKGMNGKRIKENEYEEPVFNETEGHRRYWEFYAAFRSLAGRRESPPPLPERRYNLAQAAPVHLLVCDKMF